MAWTMRNSSNDMGEILYTASPISGTIAPRGEVVITVVAFTRGKNAREAAYRGAFEVFSEDICVCRDQSIEMAIELIVTAETSAEKSYVEVLDAANVVASADLNFYIIPVDDEGLLIQGSGELCFVVASPPFVSLFTVRLCR